MSTNKKRFLAAALLVGSLAVWVPQILGQRGEARPGDPELDARYAESPELAPGVQMRFGAARTAPPTPDAATQGPQARGAPSPVPAPPAATGAPEGSADSADPLATPQPGSAGDPGAQLLRRLSAAWGEVAPEALGRGDERAPAPPPWAPREDPAEELRVYLAANPLGGILHGGERDLALFGPRVVGPGDELIPGRLVVEAVGRRHVDLRSAERSLRVELPAVAQRARGAAPTHPGSATAGAPPAGPASAKEQP